VDHRAVHAGHVRERVADQDDARGVGRDHRAVRAERRRGGVGLGGLRVHRQCQIGGRGVGGRVRGRIGRAGRVRGVEQRRGVCGRFAAEVTPGAGSATAPGSVEVARLLGLGPRVGGAGAKAQRGQ
jgi:hypothetical protein